MNEPSHLAAELDRITWASIRKRSALVEQAIALLGWAGYWPSHMEHRGSDETRLMLEDRPLAVVATHWPQLFGPNFDAPTYAINFSLTLIAPPLVMRP